MEKTEAGAFCGKILVIDRYEDDVLRLVAYLEAHDYCVKQVKNLSGMEELLSEFQPHLIVLESDMESQDGLEFLRDLKKKEAFLNCPVIVWTVKGGRRNWEASVESGAEFFIPKRCGHEELGNFINLTFESMLQVDHRVARTEEEMRFALSLVQEEYVRYGYSAKNTEHPLRLSLYNAIPETAVIIAKRGNDVLASVTVIPDSPLGLPMERYYRDEIAALRSQGRRLAEASQFAIRADIFGGRAFSMFNYKKLHFMLQLFKRCIDYSVRILKVTDIVFEVNPKQETLYKFLFCEKIGGLRECKDAEGAPANAFRLDLLSFKKVLYARKGLYSILCSEETDPVLFEGRYKLTRESLDRFFVQQSDVFKNATFEDLRHIAQMYKEGEMDVFLK